MFEETATIEEAFLESRVFGEVHDSRSRKPKAGEVLNVHQPDGFAAVVDDDEVIDSALAEDFDDFDGEVVFVDGDGGGGHVIFDWGIANLVIILISSDKVTMGKNTRESALGIDHDGRASPALQHGKDGILNWGLGSDFGEVVVLPHNFGDAGEELFAKTAARV